MKKITSACRWVRGAFVRAFHAAWVPIKRAVNRTFTIIFNTRPGLKRGALVLTLFALVAVPACVVVPHAALSVSVVWALVLFALFLGMGAERAAVEWSPTFALPPLGAFAFWRWHTLEKKRFIAVIAALVLGLVVTFIMEHAL